MEFARQDMKLTGDRKKTYIEIFVLLMLGIVIFISSSLQVKDIVSIWNQNDELGTWQGGAWLLGLDWSEITSVNGYYGYGYGFILVFFIKFFGYNTILMTHVAIYFQVFMHTSCIFIAWYCIRKMFPAVNAVIRVIASSICILTIPDLFYNYMFFSECFLRFLVWVTFGLVVSYSYNKAWYKLLLINFVAIYSFSVHQRCILLVAMSILLFLYESFVYLKKNGLKSKWIIQVIFIFAATILFYEVEYKCAQGSYISSLYSAGGTTDVGGNLLSERGYTIQSILYDVVFNSEIEKIAFQNMFGMIYYINSFDCGFTFYGFILCFTAIKNVICSQGREKIMPYIYISCMVLGGILLVSYQNANGWVYTRVELMFYGRYCSYLLSPMIMLGIMGVLTSSKRELRRNILIVVSILLLSGISTYNVLRIHEVTNLFAFTNACPGIKSIYFTDDPFSATLYHTILGVIWIFVPSFIVILSRQCNFLKQNCMVMGIFAVTAVVWVNVADREWSEQYEEKESYVTQTYDLQNILKDVEEFAAFKSYGRYGSGLLQYNNPFSKIHVCSSLEEFNEEEDELLVVSQKGIEETKAIMQAYIVEYENERYFVWRYETNK